MSQESASAWLLLLPQLPPQPSSLRVRVWRRLQQIGAVAVKNAAYALPDTDTALEDLTWLRQEIVDAGGGALLLRAQGLGTADAEIAQLFRGERDQDYHKLAEEVSEFTDGLQHDKHLEPDELLGAERTLRQYGQRMEAIRALDFFEAEGGAVAEEVLRTARRAMELRQGAPISRAVSPADLEPHRGQLWVTRSGVYVDRLACAWMLQRFVDPEARFGFVSSSAPVPEGAIPFDMAGVELGHHGTHCTTEVVAERFCPTDTALRAIAEVVHDLDLKDEGFGRLEGPGLKRLLDGICALTVDDHERVRLARPVFDALYTGFQTAGGQ
jgi:hypothetical protein